MVGLLHARRGTRRGASAGLAVAAVAFAGASMLATAPAGAVTAGSAPTCDCDQKSAEAVVSSWLHGVVTGDDVEIEAETFRGDQKSGSLTVKPSLDLALKLKTGRGLAGVLPVGDDEHVDNIRWHVTPKKGHHELFKHKWGHKIKLPKPCWWPKKTTTTHTTVRPTTTVAPTTVTTEQPTTTVAPTTVTTAPTTTTTAPTTTTTAPTTTTTAPPPLETTTTVEVSPTSVLETTTTMKPTTTLATTSTTVAVSPTSVVSSTTVAVSPSSVSNPSTTVAVLAENQTLPVTGSNTWALVTVGVGLVVAGGFAARAARSRG